MPAAALYVGRLQAPPDGAGTSAGNGTRGGCAQRSWGLRPVAGTHRACCGKQSKGCAWKQPRSAHIF
eukprot:364320-Chlamydomonas_euryale.AAC.3